MSDPSPLLVQMRQRPDWDDAVLKLTTLFETHGDKARSEAASFASLYEGQRAAMVFDVVASRQRRYTTVSHRARQFEAQHPHLTLLELATGEHAHGFGLPASRWTTIVEVAVGLEQYRHDRGRPHATDDELVAEWAADTEALRFGPRLDPYVGSVKGIGPALFAYMRMRSGADAVKPDGRVHAALKDLGFPASADERALMLVAEAAAEEVDVPRLVLDQLLWFAPQS